MNEVLRSFKEERLQDELEVDELEKTVRLAHSSLLFGFLVFSTFIVIFTILIETGIVPEPPDYSNEEILANPGILLDPFVIFPLIVGIGIIIASTGLGRLFQKREDQLDISRIDYIYHMIAKSIIEYDRENYAAAIDALRKVNSSLPVIFLDLPAPGAIPGLSHQSSRAIDRYNYKISNAADPEEALENTYEEVMTPIIEKIESVNYGELSDSIERIDTTPSANVGYLGIIRKSISPSRQTLEIFSFVVTIVVLSLIGLGIFYLVNQSLGMLVTIILFTGFHIYTSRRD